MSCSKCDYSKVIAEREIPNHELLFSEPLFHELLHEAEDIEIICSDCLEKYNISPDNVRPKERPTIFNEKFTLVLIISALINFAYLAYPFLFGGITSVSGLVLSGVAVILFSIAHINNSWEGDISQH